MCTAFNEIYIEDSHSQVKAVGVCKELKEEKIKVNISVEYFLLSFTL